MPYLDKSIPDRLRPALPTTASGVAQQGTCKNYTTAKHSENKSRKRGGRQVKKQRKVWKGRCSLIRVDTLNIETMTVRGRELADMMERRNVKYCAYRKQSEKGVKQEILEVDANYFTTDGRKKWDRDSGKRGVD